MTPEEVQKEWHQIALAKCIQPQEYHKGRNDFKSALREEIEKEKHYVGTSGSSVNFKQGYIEALIRVENLIEYVTPKK